MKQFLRFTALVTLASFIGLSALESFHTHATMQTNDHCSICQIAQSTPGHISTAAVAAPHAAHTETIAAIIVQPYFQFLAVAHGLSPPIA